MRAMGPSANVRTVPGVRRKRVRGCHFPQGCPRTVTWLCGFAWKRHAWGMCARMQRVCARLGTAGNFGTVLLGVLDCAPFVSHPGGHLSRPPGWADGAGELRACAVCAARQGSGARLFQTKPSAHGRRWQWRWRQRQRRWQAARGQGQRLRVNDQRGARSSTFQTQLLLAFRVQVTIRLERCKPFVCCGGTAALARR